MTERDVPRLADPTCGKQLCIEDHNVPRLPDRPQDGEHNPVQSLMMHVGEVGSEATHKRRDVCLGRDPLASLPQIPRRREH
jgi:hypothetical protein